MYVHIGHTVTPNGGVMSDTVLAHVPALQWSLADVHTFLTTQPTGLAVVTTAQGRPCGIADCTTIAHAREFGHVELDDALHLWPLPRRHHPPIIIANQWRVRSTDTGDYVASPPIPQPCTHIAWDDIAALIDPRTVVVLRSLTALATIHAVQVFLVGGAARSVFDRRPIHDIDLAITGPLPAFVNAVAATLHGQVEHHAPLGTASVIFAEAQHIQYGLSRLDFVPTRREVYPTPGVLPSVHPSDIITDVGRRDITVNAIAITLVPDGDCAVYDPYAGRRALRRRQVQVLHPLSFCDDPTRVLRIARLASRLDLHVGKRVVRMMQQSSLYPAFAHVSPQRWYHEILKTLAEADPWPAIQRMQRWRLWAAIHPAFAHTRPQLASIRHVAVADRFAVLVWGAKPELLQALIAQWHLVPQLLRQLIALKGILAQPRSDSAISVGALTVACKPFASSLLTSIALIDPSVRQPIARVLHARDHADTPMITGHDLRALGIAAGPIMRDILTALEIALYAGILIAPTAAQQIAWVRAHYPDQCTDT